MGDHGFLDKPADSTGLTAVGARMFDPGLGTFVSVDPIMDLADPQQWNAYAYSNNNPVTWSDPTGLLFSECHDGSHSCKVDRNGNISAKRNWDKCERGAISCVKRKSGSGGAPVYVRECYTAYACNFYSTHTDGFETSSGHSAALVDKTVSAAERAARVAAAKRAAKIAEEREAAAAREAAQQKREQENSWLESAWNATWNYAKTHKRELTHTAANILLGIAIGAAAALCVGTAGIGCAVGAAIAVGMPTMLTAHLAIDKMYRRKTTGEEALEYLIVDGALSPAKGVVQKKYVTDPLMDKVKTRWREVRFK